ncbi:LAQU0S08e02344g1_1 [Lachancea quebecensis]|uniref:LAQU0S08e02344g1_1 n=1 Tax=Lachancea quebecensis TaxID=1654605 RepID=A0A0P1KTD8_9SACH|nr:LAQU0S08e02344g1_1 [Lachancea quebecensis]
MPSVPAPLELAGAHDHAVLACRLLRAGSLALSAGLDPHLSLWDLSSGQNYTISSHHRAHAAITALDALGDRCAVTGSSDTRIALCDLETGQLLRGLVGHRGVVNQVRALAESRFASVGDDGALKIWDASGAKRPVWQAPSEFPLLAVAQDPQQEHLVYASGLEPVIRAYDLRQSADQALSSWPAAHSDAIASLDVSDNGKLCTLAFDHQIHICDAKLEPTREGTRLLASAALPAPANPHKFLQRCKFVRQDRFVAAQGSLFDATSGRQVLDFASQIASKAFDVIDMDYDSRSDKVLISTEQGSLYVCQV